MSEYILPSFFEPGHIIETNTTVLDLYRLLSLFYSSKKFAELHTSLHDDPVNYLLRFEAPEITRILISTAVTARIIDDRDGRFLNNYNTVCGQLIKNVEDPTTRIDLFLREACNKIIHAQKVHSDVSKCDNGAEYLNPIMYYYGEFKGEEWKAILDIERFAFTFIEFIAKYNE